MAAPETGSDATKAAPAAAPAAASPAASSVIEWSDAKTTTVPEASSDATTAAAPPPAAGTATPVDAHDATTANSGNSGTAAEPAPSSSADAKTTAAPETGIATTAAALAEPTPADAATTPTPSASSTITPKKSTTKKTAAATAKTTSAKSTSAKSASAKTTAAKATSSETKSVNTATATTSPKDTTTKKATTAAATSVKPKPKAKATPVDPETALEVAEKKRLAALAKRDDELWLRECICLFVAIMIIAIIVIIFAVNTGKPQSRWPAYISINSLVSVLAAILKPALSFPIIRCLDELKWMFTGGDRTPHDLRTFDAAGRGPWGSLMLLVKKFGKLATLGAVLSLLNIAVDPFLQEMLKYESCTVQISSDSATVARTNYYYGSLGSAGANNATLDQDLAKAFYEGVIVPPANATDLIDIYCPAATCSFGQNGGLAYSSLAVCYMLEDLSQQVNYTNQDDEGNSDNLTLPIRNSDKVLWLSPGDLNVSPVAMSHSGNIAIPDGPELNNSIFSFQILGLHRNLTASTADVTDYYPFAFGAYLYPCVKTYSNVSIVQQILYETVSDTQPLLPIPYHWSGLHSMSIAGNFPAQAGLGINCSAATSPTNTQFQLAVPEDDYDVYVGEPDGLLPNATDPDAITRRDYEPPNGIYYDPQCTYYFDSNVIESLKSLASEMFDDKVLLGDPGNASDVSGDTLLRQYYGNGLVNMSTAHDFLEGIVDSVTAEVRRNTWSRPDDDYVNYWASGSEFNDDICIEVVWPWLALPAAVGVLTLVFFFGVMFASRRSGKGRAPRTHAAEAAWRRMHSGGANAAMGSAFHGIEAEGVADKGMSTVIEKALEVFH